MVPMATVRDAEISRGAADIAVRSCGDAQVPNVRGMTP
jgi:hypothetical protein